MSHLIYLHVKTYDSGKQNHVYTAWKNVRDLDLSLPGCLHGPALTAAEEKNTTHFLPAGTEMVPCWHRGMNPCPRQDAWHINQHISCHLEGNSDDEYFTANSDDAWDDSDLEE